MVNVAFIIPSTYIGEKNGLALWILVHTSYVILNEWGTQWKGGTSVSPMIIFDPLYLTVSSRELNCHHIRESWLIPQFSGLSLRDQMAWSNTTPTIIKMCRNDKKKSMFTAAVVTTFTITIHTHYLQYESSCSTIVTNCAYQWTKGGPLMSTTMILHFQYVTVCSILESNSKKSGDCWWWPQILVNATMSFFMMMICWVSPLS